ncbi:MAG TPA: ribosomal protein S18-alanine N-acetyltransferase [Deltaproteobacteria bacterium]|nr:ribosomal protein S18-alanine N-acetyltransferase [Deltaproteobacteria bacterium]
MHGADRVYELDIRHIEHNDLDAVLEVERASFSSPWDRGTFETTLEDSRCIALKVTSGVELAGYCIALDLTSMVHILTLAVHPAWRGRGLGRRLVEEVLRRSASKGKVCAVLEVRTSNVPAKSLYSSLGFVHVSTWRGYYTDTNEDASIMVKDLRVRPIADAEAAIVENREVAPGTWRLELDCAIPQAEPGQFVMVQVDEGLDPFLRRPLAVLSQRKGRVELLYRVRGRGTALLAKKNQGEGLRILGPLGRGFTKRASDRTIYVAGGTGLPPLVFLAERLEAGVFIVGAKTISETALLDRVGAIPGVALVVMTEDGSSGDIGLATDGLRRVMDETPDGEEIAVYACGPMGMLKEAAALARERGARIEVSLDERMGCGFGVCAGCVVETRHGLVRVCREGPVFDAEDLLWG